MKSFLIRRVSASFVAIIFVTVLVFLLIHVIPGDPAELLLGEAASAEEKLSFRKMLGLHLPLHQQYLVFFKSLFSTWGYSISRNKEVISLILERFPATLLLAASGFVTGMCLSVPVGVLSAIKKDSIFDRIVSVLSMVSMSIPIFVLGPFLTLIFAIRLQWVPVAGYGSISHLLLPSIALGLGLFGILTRMVRASFLEVLREDYMRTAHAKGLAPLKIFYIHGLKNAIIPVLTLSGSIFGGLLAGAVLTETLFDWPGIGKLFFSAFQSRDYPLIQGVVLWISISYFIVNLTVDIVYFLVDPRITAEGANK